jgi:multiple sugar transport system substrate-binding protein
MNGHPVHRRPIRAAFGVAAAVAALTISACSSSGSSSSTSAKTIKFVAAEYSPKSGPYWESVAAAFKKKTGISVKVQMISWADIHQQVSTMVQTKQLPDVLNLDTFSAYAQEGLLWPANDIETPALRANLPQNLQRSGEYNGTAYGIPLIASDSTLFYNKTLFAKAGLSGPPTTTAELQADAKAITDLPGGNIGFAVSLGPEAPQIDWAVVMYNFGGNYVTNGKWTINSPQNLAALQYLNTLAKNKLTEVNPGRTNRTNSGTWQLFSSGKVAMVIGQSALQTQLKQTPNVKYALAPFPSSNGGPSSGLGIADYMMAFKKKNNRAAVQQFLDFAYQADNYHKFVTNEGLLPVTSDEQRALATNAAFGPYIAALKNAVFAPVGEKSWDAVLGAMKNSLGLAVQGQEPKKVLDQLQTTATSGS